MTVLMTRAAARPNAEVTDERQHLEREQARGGADHDPRCPGDPGRERPALEGADERVRRQRGRHPAQAVGI